MKIEIECSNEKVAAILQAIRQIDDGEVLIPLTRGKWEDDGYCNRCGAPIATDSKIDILDEADNRFCYSCGARNIE
ncbi:MAG: hypothetical protein J6L88_02455 [Clostridia bacterium]|nr:hypothetical protein [Clostridia bacterium]